MSKNHAPGSDSFTGAGEERYAQLAKWAENIDTLPPSSRITKSEAPGAGRSLLEAALGSAEAVDRAVGRPSLGRKGTSPSRTLRLPSELDAALVARAGGRRPQSERGHAGSARPVSAEGVIRG